MIYAVQVLDGKFIKVGFSKSESTRQRIASLQTGSPFEITEVVTVPGTIRQEQAIHGVLLSAFSRIRVPIPPNEWYPGANPFFVEFLEHLKVSPGQALAFCDKYNENVKQPGKGESSLSPNVKWPKLKKFRENQ